MNINICFCFNKSLHLLTNKAKNIFAEFKYGMSVMKVKMSNSVKLPYRMAKGSELERFKRAEASNKQVFNLIKGKAEGDYVSLDDIKEALYSKLYVMITCLISKEFRDGASILGGTTLLQSKFTKELSGYEILLPIQNNDSIHIQDLHVVIHEFRHLFDMINNPKINQRKIACSAFSDGAFKLDYMDSIYNSKIYTRKKYDKNAIQCAIEMLLAPFSKEEQIDVMQLVRYRLKMEYNAYKEASNIQRELKRLYGDKFDKDDYIPVREFNFPKKIRLLEDTLKQLISEYRTENNKF